MQALQTSANSAVPAYRQKPALDSADAKGHAAGVLLVAPDGDILLLRRGGQQGVDNFVGHWALPGGGVEEGETPELGADREMGEEIGVKPEGAKKLLDQVKTPNGMIYHTFAQPVPAKFAPKLNDEHTGYAWAPLDFLPEPLHPAVKNMLQTRLGVAADMKPEDWSGLRDGFLKWTAEEEAETEHLTATDSATKIALDEKTVREKSRDGHLHVARTPISTATVSPYRGSEIPNFKALGLDPDRVYQLLRAPEELAKGATTFNGKPLLHKHVPITAKKHAKQETIGALGNECVFEDPYLYNSLVIWPQEDIDDVESDAKKEISAGYHYRAEMTPGIFRGMRYDGVMMDIVGNHAAIVKDGRAGPDVVVGDSTENLHMTKPTRMAALALAATAASISPLLAMDSKITLPKDIFTGFTTKNLKDGKAKLLAGVRTAVNGKLRPGLALDASMEGLAKAIDAFSEGDLPEALDEPVGEEKDKAMTAGSVIEPMKDLVEEKKGGYDAEPLKAFLKEKGMAEDDIAKVCDMMPKPALDEETPEAKAAREKKETDEKTAKDNEMKDVITKPAMDAALKDMAESVRATERGIRVALAQVQPYVGVIPETEALAFDSGEAVKRHALKMLNVKAADTMHADALDTVLAIQPLAGAKPSQRNETHLAMDAAAGKDFASRFPGAERIRAA